MTASVDLELLRQPSYTPPRRAVPALFESWLGSHSLEEKRALTGALRRVPVEACQHGLTLLKAAGEIPPELPGLVGRLAVELASRFGNTALLVELMSLLAELKPRAARQVIIAIGKLPPHLAPHVEAPLLESFAKSTEPADTRAIAEALGKLGGEKSLPALRAALHDAKSSFLKTPVLAQTLERAVLRLERTRERGKGASAAVAAHATPTREAASPINAAKPLPQSSRVVLRCRAGLTAIVVDELRARGLLRGAGQGLHIVEPEGPGKPGISSPPARVTFDGSGPLSALFAVRTFSSLAFALPAQLAAGEASDEAALEHAVVKALVAKPTRELLSALSSEGGLVRYRLHFCDGGHRRALVWRIAAAVRRSAPELLNDPKESPWQVEIHDQDDGRGGLLLELVPRKLVDPRFSYRQRDVPAASHPPLAAALARLCEAGEDDVVWDPFVGSGSELIELALTTRCRQLFGSDRDARALSSARANIEAAAVDKDAIKLFQADAGQWNPPLPRITRIVTNPPMGRRTRPGPGDTGREGGGSQHRLSAFLEMFIRNAAASLAVRGRLVFISPQPRFTAHCAAAVGLRQLLARPVDLNGFWGSLEVWEKAAPFTNFYARP